MSNSNLHNLDHRTDVPDRELLNKINEHSMSPEQSAGFLNPNTRLCHFKGYFSYEAQAQLLKKTDPYTLMIMQKLALHTKRKPPFNLVEFISHPDFKKALEKEFIDLAYVSACTSEELALVLFHFEHAMESGIKDAWDPEFATFYRLQQPK